MVTAKKRRQQRVEQGRTQKDTNHQPTRSVIYPTLATEIYDSANPMTVAKAKELLGWREETDKEPLGNRHNPELQAIFGVKVRCENNLRNRHIYTAVLRTLSQEHLRGRWRFNGEPIIIGNTGSILNGQHTLISLILAAQQWAETPLRYPLWKGEPTLEKLVIYGVEESSAVIDTMDTCKPRSLADVVFQHHYFKDLPAKAHVVASRMLDYAVRMLWARTAAHTNPFGIVRTHAESIAFVEAHPKLLEAVKHVYEEDEDKKISKWLSSGYAAALLYLMASSKSDPEKYYGSDAPSEQLLDLSRWEVACRFFVELAAGADSLRAVRSKISELANEEDGAGFKDRWAVLVKGWAVYSQGKPVTPKHIELKYITREGATVLAEEPLLGGIDVGDEGVPLKSTDDPTPEALENGKEEVKAKRFGKSKVAKRAGKEWRKGDTAWVHVPGEEAYFARLKDNPFKSIDGCIRVMVDAEDGDWEVQADQLSLKQFEAPSRVMYFEMKQ